MGKKTQVKEGEVYLCPREQDALEVLGWQQQQKNCNATVSTSSLLSLLGCVSMSQVSRLLTSLCRKGLAKAVGAHKPHASVGLWQLTDLGWNIYQQLRAR